MKTVILWILRRSNERLCCSTWWLSRPGKRHLRLFLQTLPVPSTCWQLPLPQFHLANSMQISDQAVVSSLLPTPLRFHKNTERQKFSILPWPNTDSAVHKYWGAFCHLWDGSPWKLNKSRANVHKNRIQNEKTQTFFPFLAPLCQGRPNWHTQLHGGQHQADCFQTYEH